MCLEGQVNQCESNGHSCTGDNGYKPFDDCAAKEMRGITAHDVINGSKFCFALPIDMLSRARKRKKDGQPTLNGLLSVLGKRIGVYHIWLYENEYCDDHGMYFLRCIYVGKGSVRDRIKDHIKSRLTANEILYISFYECENRIAKYVEQLFLDKYKPELNVEEKYGEFDLFARWSEERFSIGCGNESLSKLFSDD